MELMKIAMDDVYPDEKNPREDFGDIQAMAASFALNAVNPGEPVNPVVVVRDGGIFRIVDGERRYRAMKTAGTTSCHAVVCSGMDEANAMVAMLTTDEKQQLTDIERSRGVQQMLLLGVDPETVDKAAKRDSGTAERVKKAMLAVDDAADDMTLDRLLAIDEFSDDPEAVEKLSTCPENEWRWRASQMRSDKKEREARAPFEDVLHSHGLEFAQSRRDWSVRWSETAYEDPIELEAAIASDPESAEKGLWEWSKYIRRVVHAVESEEKAEEDPMKAEVEAEKDRFYRIVEAGNARRAEEYLKSLSAPHIDALAVQAAAELFDFDEYEDEVAEVADAAGIGSPVLAMCDWLRCAALSTVVDDTPLQLDPDTAKMFADPDIGKRYWREARLYAEIIDSWSADGFPPSDGDKEVLEAAVLVQASHISEEEGGAE